MNYEYRLRKAEAGKRYIVAFKKDTLGQVVKAERDAPFNVGDFDDNWTPQNERSAWLPLDKPEFPLEVVKHYQAVVKDDAGTPLICPFLFPDEERAKDYCKSKNWKFVLLIRDKAYEIY